MSDITNGNSEDDDSDQQAAAYEDGNTVFDDDESNSKTEENNEAENCETGERVEVDQDVALTAEDMRNCLTLLSKTDDGLGHAYVHLDARERKLTDVGILLSYVHLRYVNLSQNNLVDVSVLNSLPNLLSINLDNNKLSSAAVPCDLPYLQVASFSANRIQSMSGISHPQLETLILHYNDLRVCNGLEPDRLGRLHTLELRGNRLTSLSGLHLPTLKNLFLASNAITSLVGLDRLTNLAVLHLRENQLESLDGFSDKLRCLVNINLRANRIVDVKECRALAQLPALKKLVLSENPLSEDEDYRLEVLVEVGTLQTLDKYPISQEEMEEAAGIASERRRRALNNIKRQNSENITGNATTEE